MPRIALQPILVLTCLLHGTLLADTVEMKNGLMLEGKVHLETPEFIVLLVYHEAGRVRIPRHLIKSIDYDFATKAAALTEDDYKGHYELGVWAMGKGKYTDAIQEFEKVKGHQGAGADLYKLLGQACDKIGLLDKAYESYKEHLRLHPEDAEVQKRVDELAKKLNLGAEAPANKPQLWEGLEVDFRWNAEKWDNANPCTVQTTADKDTGNRMLVMQAQPGNKDKVALGGTGAAMNLSESKQIIFKVFHNGVAAVDLAVAFKNQANEFFETKMEKVPPNTWTNVIVPIAGGVFKSTRNQFGPYTDTLGGKEDIRQIYFLLYGPCAQRGLTLYVDHIGFR